MRKTAVTLSKVKMGKRRRLWCVTWPKIGKGRNRQFFKDKTEAETLLAKKKIEQENQGRAGLALSDRQRVEYLQCEEKLRPFGKTISDAITFYLPHLHATNRTCNAVELVTELLEIKQADGASRRYIEDLRSRLGQFAAVFNGKPIAEITSTEIDSWLRSLSDKETGKRVASTTRNNFRRVLITAFNFASEHGYCVGNPAEKAAKAKHIDAAVGILAVDQTARLLENSTVALLPYVAIGAFAGLRRAELERLDWYEVDLKSKLIEVTAQKAKSARRRFVKIQPNLLEWLWPYKQLRGNVTPPDYRELLDSAREAAKINDWPNNALRHGYASYHLARFNDAAALALELGHTNSNLVFQHYRQVVRPSEAKRYWKLAPATKQGRKVIHFATA
jgi:integrase